MAVAIKPFRKLQLAQQSAFGTGVAATSQLLGDWSVDEIADRYRSPYPRGYNARVGGAGVTIMKGGMITVPGEASAEEAVWIFNGGVKKITPTGPTDGTYTWLWTPELTAAPTEGYYTFEQVEGDGTTNHVARQYCDAHLESLEISMGDATKNIQWTHVWNTRASQTLTPTAALTAQSTQEPLVGGLSKLFLDTTYAGMGGTQLTGEIKSWKWKYTSPFEPKYTADGRTDLDLTGYHYSRGFNANLDIVAEIDATLATALITAWRANSLRYIRLSMPGSITGGGSTARLLQIDGAYRFLGKPQYNDDTRTVAVSLESLRDVTGTKAIEVTAINAMSAVTTA